MRTRISARLRKAQRNRTGVAKGRTHWSTLCRCLGCRCTASVQIPLEVTSVTRRQATCTPCQRRQHRHHDGQAYVRTSTRPTPKAKKAAR